MDAFILWQVGKMPGECFERICLKHGKEHWLYRPSSLGARCFSNGEHPGIECRCDECDFAGLCWRSTPMTPEEEADISKYWLALRCAKLTNPG